MELLTCNLYIAKNQLAVPASSGCLLLLIYQQTKYHRQAVAICGTMKQALLKAGCLQKSISILVSAVTILTNDSATGSEKCVHTQWRLVSSEAAPSPHHLNTGSFTHLILKNFDNGLANFSRILDIFTINISMHFSLTFLKLLHSWIIKFPVNPESWKELGEQGLLSL